MAGLYISFESQLKLDQVRNEYRYYCSCGHSLQIYPMEHKDKKLCSWCGHYVHVNKKEQDKENFKYKLGKLIGGIR